MPIVQGGYKIEILDLRSAAVLKSYVTREFFRNMVDREMFPSLKNAA
jgi:hypothetical protein